MSNQKPTEEMTTSTWIIMGAAILIGAWLFGACQRGITLRTCGNNQGEYIYSWKGTEKTACVIKKGGYDNSVEIVTPNGSGKGSFRGNYVVGQAGGTNVSCAGKDVTGLPYGICSD